MTPSKLAESVVKKIFATDKRIQFCALVDPEGKIEAGGMRPGVRAMEPRGETARIVTRNYLKGAIDAAIDPFLGRASWAIIRREKLIQITFPLRGRRQLQITAKLAYPISKVPKLGRYVDQLDVTA